MRSLGSKIKTLSPKKNKTQLHKRPRGNSFYSLAKQVSPRICKHCDQEGRVGPGDILDHIFPLALGGSNDIKNLQWLCHHHDKIKFKEDLKKIKNGTFSPD